ncbi:MAG: hypothetical protein P4L66_14640 [Acetobacteraceae bacterium]|nr:hypothetical protein [Acetobacteraceae bacterium]
MTFRILLATSFHEHLAALTGFHLNWQSALSGRMTTLAHLSATTRPAMLAEAAECGVLPSAPGLVINPVSIPTRFGSALPMLIHNRLMARRLGMAASHLCLASPYLYAVMPGLDMEIEQADAGLPAVTYAPHAHWFWANHAAADPYLTALLAHLGAEMRIGRADGVFMPMRLFDELLALLHRFYPPDALAQPEPLYPLEEVIFPTLLPILLGSSDRIVATRARVWEGESVDVSTMNAAIASGLHASVKRVPQIPGDRVRQAVLRHLPGEAVLGAYCDGAAG